jgi:DnaJ-class molecular chaperone
MNNNQTLYEILSVEKTATVDEIKKSYKKLAAKWHPDKCHDESRKEEYDRTFKKIGQAYEILSDPKKREIYDETNEVDNIEDIIRQKEMFQGSPFQGFPFPGFPFQGSPFQNGMQTSVRFTPDIVINVRLTLDEIYAGKIFNEKINRTIINLSNSKQNKMSEEEEVTITVNKGIGNGQQILMYGKGNKLISDGKVVKVGNIVITVNEIPHNIFKRSQLQPSHLYMNQKISVFQALLGDFDFITSGLNKEKIVLNLGKNVIKPGTVISIQKKGMITSNGIGNLYVIFDIEFPNEITEVQRNALKSMTDYVDTKRKKVNDVEWTFTTSEYLEKLLNTDDREENYDGEQPFMRSGMHTQSMQCAQQ